MTHMGRASLRFGVIFARNEIGTSLCWFLKALANRRKHYLLFKKP